MIKTEEQAVAVQRRRQQSGRYGYAKAVRRYLQRTYILTDYRRARGALPVSWRPTKTEEEANEHIDAA